MRNTYLNRLTMLVAAVFLIISIVFGALRNTVFTDTGKQEREPAQGAMLFKEKGCSQCHLTGSTEIKIGPGLKGLFDKKGLPTSNRPATEENVRAQLKDPYQDMPSFADRLTEEELDQIISYLKTL